MSTNISIIVVDDEAPILRLMQAFLERLGYKVEGFGTASEALARFQSEPDRFHLAVVDLTLPDMAGKELAVNMAELNPSLRVLLCSGYPFEIASLPADLQPRFSMLLKPFVPNMLTASVQELLKRK
jgi:DNA-binding NtrC family response regulator